MTDSIIRSFDIWTTAQGIKSKGRVKSIENIFLEGIAHLRDLILELAVMGRLVSQDPKDEPAREFLKKIADVKAKLVKEGKIKKQTPLPEIEENEKPCELPLEWCWVRLGLIGLGSTGKTPSTNILKYFDGDIPFLGPGQIMPGGKIIDSDKTLTDEGCEYSTIADKGDILMVCIGGSIGKNAILKSKVAFNQQINCIRPILVNTNYLSLSMNAPSFQASILEKASGTATPIINRSKWEELLIALPPLAEQNRIVAKVDELMVLCDKLEEQQTNNLKTHQILVNTLLDTLTQAKDSIELQSAWECMAAHFNTLFCTEDSIDQLKQIILKLAVMGKLVPQDPNDEPASELLKKIAREKTKLIKEGSIKTQKPLPAVAEDEMPFLLPNGWIWTRLGNYSIILSGNSFKSEDFNNQGGTKVVKITNAGVGEFIATDDYLPKDFISKYKQYIVQEDDLILALTRPYISNGLKISKCPSSYNNSLLNQRVCTIKVINNVDFVFLFLRTPLVLNIFKERFGNSGLQPNLKVSDVTDLVFPIPPLLEQKRIVDKVDELFAVCDVLKATIVKNEDTKMQLAEAVVEDATA